MTTMDKNKEIKAAEIAIELREAERRLMFVYKEASGLLSDCKKSELKGAQAMLNAVLGRYHKMLDSFYVEAGGSNVETRGAEDKSRTP